MQIPSPKERLGAYPFELTGGMRHPVVIAMALSCNPKVLLADEPTTALDVTVQARILDLIKELQVGSDMGVVIVTHDLAVAAQVADDVAVMYGGRLVETGPVADVLLDPTHPYTIGLLEANVRPGQPEPPRSIPGAPPSLARLPDGCAFAPRCSHATVTCWQERPSLDCSPKAARRVPPGPVLDPFLLRTRKVPPLMRDRLTTSPPAHPARAPPRRARRRRHPHRRGVRQRRRRRPGQRRGVRRRTGGLVGRVHRRDPAAADGSGGVLRIAMSAGNVRGRRRRRTRATRGTGSSVTTSTTG